MHWNYVLVYYTKSLNNLEQFLKKPLRFEGTKINLFNYPKDHSLVRAVNKFLNCSRLIMNSRQPWNLHQRHKFLWAEASMYILKYCISRGFHEVFSTADTMLFHWNTRKTGNNAILREHFMESEGVWYLRMSCWPIKNRTNEWMQRTTAAHNCHGKTKNLTAKTKYLTAKPKTSRQKQNTSRQNQNPHGKTKDLTAKPNTSQQKPNTSWQKQIPTAKPKLFCFLCEVFGFAMRYFAFAVRFWVCSEVFCFCREVFGFAGMFLVLPWGFWFCSDSCGPPQRTSEISDTKTTSG